MLKKMITLTLIFLLTIILLQNCDTTEPPIDNLKPGRRDYGWEIDTIQVPLAYYDRIWGSSPEDVWIIGGGGGLDNTIFHFDGKAWKNDGISRAINPTAIWGFAQNDVWIGGYGNIWHFDGNKWSEEFNYYPFPDNIDRVIIMDIWGDSPIDVYASGFADSSSIRKGVIFHYDGKHWSRVNIRLISATLMRIKRGIKTRHDYYIWGLVENNFGVDTTKIFKFNGKELTEIYSNLYNQETKCSVQEIDDEIYFTIGNKLYRNFVNNPIIINNFSNYYSSIYGRNIKDIFWSMEDGTTHFNGSDIQYILKYNGDVRSREIFLFDKELFILANNFNRGLNLIFRGKLKE